MEKLSKKRIRKIYKVKNNIKGIVLISNEENLDNYAKIEICLSSKLYPIRINICYWVLKLVNSFRIENIYYNKRWDYLRNFT